MKYDAFISYKHAELDSYIAKKVHKFLETYMVPKSIKKKIKKDRINRVFRDQEELPIGSSLTENIEAALRESEYLIVICSPRSVKSVWVKKEIQTFISMHGRKNVFAILVEGEPDESFPEEILVDDAGKTVEPLAADIRGKNKLEINKKFKTEIIRLIAPLLGCTYDDLKQRHKERQVKRRYAILASIALISLLFAGYAIANYQMINMNYNEKLINQSKYLADTSLEVLNDGDRKKAALIAKEALPGPDNDRPFVAKAQYALTEALGCYDTGTELKLDKLLTHDFTVCDYYLDSTGRYIAAYDEDDRVYLWDVERGKVLFKELTADNDNNIGSIIIDIVVDDGIVYVMNRNGIVAYDDSGNVAWKKNTSTDYLSCNYYSEKNIVVYFGEESLEVFNLSTGKKDGEISYSSVKPSYFSDGAFSSDGNMFCFACENESDDGDAFLKIINLETMDEQNIGVSGKIVYGLSFAGDDAVSLVISNGEKDSYLSSENYTLEFIDLASGQMLWSNDFIYSISLNYLLELHYEEQNDEYEIFQDQVILVTGDKVTVFDKKDGSVVSEIEPDFDILSYYHYVNKPFGFLGIDDDSIKIVNVSTGDIYSENDIEIGNYVSDIQVNGNIVAIRSRYSKDIIILSYTQGSTVKEIREDEDSLGYYVNEDESVYAVNCMSNNSIMFYDDNDKLIDQYASEDVIRSDSIIGFIKDDFVWIDEVNNLICYYDYKTNKTETICPIENFCNLCVSSDKKKCLFKCYSNDNYYIYDLENRKFIKIKKMNDDMEKSLDKYNLVAISNDGNKIAYVSKSAMVKILDVETNIVIDKFDGKIARKGELYFSIDNNKIIISGDDYFLRVYDVESKKFIYSAENPYILENIHFHVEDNTIDFIGGGYMYIVDGNTYQTYAAIKGGQLFLPNSKKIYIKQIKDIYTAEYMTLDRLLEEEEKMYGDEELSDIDRIKYNVD